MRFVIVIVSFLAVLTVFGQDSVLVVQYDLSILPTDSLKESKPQLSNTLLMTQGSAEFAVDCSGWKLKVKETRESVDESVYQLNIESQTLYNYVDGDKGFCRKKVLEKGIVFESETVIDTTSVMGYTCSLTSIQSDVMSVRVFHSESLMLDFGEFENGLVDEISLLLGQTNSIPLRIELLSENGEAWLILGATEFRFEKRKRKDWCKPKFKEEVEIEKLCIFN